MDKGKTVNQFAAIAGPLKATGLNVMQVNLGRYCNQSCTHCHVEASPDRMEMMSWETMESILAVLSSEEIGTVELTGGAPELHPHFDKFLARLSRMAVQVIVRTNLTALLEPEAAGLAAVMKERCVHLFASLPCYAEENVRFQRGDGTFEKSIAALKMLNHLGYGCDHGEALPLTLVFNPIEAMLPPNQKDLEDLYREELSTLYGIYFTRLIALCNMPVGRFRQALADDGQEEVYMRLLKENFNRGILDKIMCRTNISVDWNGILYDCDFNLALQRPVSGTSSHIRDFDRASFAARTIGTGEHCFGCTAGSGSSCGGALEVHSQ